MTAAAADWFQVDKEGLAAILQRRGVEFALFELVSNALDTEAKVIKVELEPIDNKPLVRVSITDDDPNGFTDLAHAFTLFAPSKRKGVANKRGRFNLGEKLVLAICENAAIYSTTGTVTFDQEGRESFPRQKRKAGSMFVGTLRMRRHELAQAIDALHTIIVPPGVLLTVNEIVINTRKPLATFTASLATEIADADGNLKRSRARAEVKVYEPFAGETATLYEMGIPVVETGDRWHVDVEQKVPLNMDRDNVPPAFLRELRTHVLNTMHSQITPDDATSNWGREAAGEPLASNEAVKAVLDARFGEKRVAYDPSDPEANKIAVSKGYTVVHGGSLSAGEWENARRAEAILPAGKVTPSPKPFSPDGAPLVMIDPSDWTDSVRQIVIYATQLGKKLLGVTVRVDVTDTPKWKFNATFGDGHLILNLGALGKDFFAHGESVEVDRLLLHEFSHHFCPDHLSTEFAEAGFKLGAKLKRLALDEPLFFES